jgi:DNA invertase Pin-like site-specific DNA recombinase
VGQSLEVQRDKLKHCHQVFEEQKSGTADQPPRLKAGLEYVRPGDTLVVTRLGRLARSTLHLCQMADKLQGQQVDLQVLDQKDTSHASGRLLFHMLSAICQFETELRSERQMDGIAKARRKEGELIRELMAGDGLSKATVYGYLN